MFQSEENAELFHFHFPHWQQQNIKFTREALQLADIRFPSLCIVGKR